MISVDDEDKEEEEENREKFKKTGSQARTYLTFSDFDTFRKTFPKIKPKQNPQKICPITRLPAKYFDPVTRLPYASLQAFR